MGLDGTGETAPPPSRREALWGMALLSATGELRSVDQAFAKMQGRPARELVDRPWTALCPTGCTRELTEALQRAQTEGYLVFEHEHPDAGGRPIQLRMELTPLRDQAGELQYVLRVADLSGWPESLREARLASLVESCDDAIVAVELDGTITHWNRSAERLYGWPAEEALGRSIFTFVPAEHREEVEQMLATIRAGGHLAPRETERQRADGVRIPVSITVSPIADARGRLVGASWITRDVTDRTRIGEELARERAILRAVIASSPAVIYLKDLEGRYLLINQHTLVDLHMSEADFLGHTDHDVFPADVADQLAANDRRAVALRAPLQVEETVRRGETERTFASAKFPVFASDGHVWAVGGISLDLSEQRAAERERALLASLVEASTDIIAAVSLDGSVIAWNPAGERTLGHPAAEVIGRCYRGLVPSERRAELDAVVKRVAGGESVAPFAMDALHRDGRRVPVEVTLSPIRAGDGVVGVVGVARNVTEQRRAAETLRRSERLLRTVIDALPVGVWIVGERGMIADRNPAAERIWGGARFVAVEGYGQYEGWWADTGEPIAPHEWAAARAVERGETSIGEVVRIRAFDGSFKTILHSAVPLRDDGEVTGAVVVNEDITALRETTDALRRAVAAREEILNVVSHDLRSPLNVVSMTCDLLSSGPLDESAVRRGLQRMRRAVQAMNRLIVDLVDLVRVDQGRLALRRAPEGPGDLVQEAVELLRPAVDAASIHLSFAAPAGLPAVIADHDRILQVFSNLIGNAVKFTPPGGRIHVGADSRNGAVIFSVSDTGRGVAEEQLAHLFDRYWQAAPSDERGLGLGLPIAAGIVAAHGGRIWARSVPGRGSTFCFTLPIVERAGVRPRARGPE